MLLSFLVIGVFALSSLTNINGLIAMIRWSGLPLFQAGLAQGKTGTRKQRRELKNKKKKVFGIKKATVGGGGK